jgi:hypothetical protein
MFSQCLIKQYTMKQHGSEVLLHKLILAIHALAPTYPGMVTLVTTGYKQVGLQN